MESASLKAGAPLRPRGRWARLHRRKTIEETLQTTEQEGFKLKRDLSAVDITVFGIGVTLGAGIFVLTGVAAATEAGPAVTISFAVAALVCALAAICYAEIAAMVPAAGSAYTYAYATLGEFVAFVIGWDLVLEFTVGSAAVAIGWSGYLNATLTEIFGISLPAAISAPPGEGGVVNLPGMLLIGLMVFLLVRGVKIASRVNVIMTLLIIAALLLVVFGGMGSIDTANWSPYFPFGISGVIGGAALVFFAFIGFDVVATTAEECRNPKRDMPIGILASLAIVTVLYVVVAAVITGMVGYQALNSEAPVADAFSAVNQPWMAAFIFAGALIALTNTVLVLMLGQSRVAFAMARDRLLPKGLARTHPRFRTPYRVTLIIGALVAILAGVTPISVAAELVNIGTLFAFILVAAGVLILRKRSPEVERRFRVPLVPWLPLASIALSAVLVATLEPLTWVRFGVWMALGLVVFALYSRRSLLGRRHAAEDAGEQPGTG
jgi:APA family basic amino acid/polyamine antiporter